MYGLKLSKDILEFLEIKREDSFLAKIITELAPGESIYIISKYTKKKYGSTWPIWGDSSIIPEGHIIHISNPTVLVLCHELAHIKDFFRKNKKDDHDDIFLSYWENLCLSVYYLLHYEKRIG